MQSTNTMFWLMFCFTVKQFLMKTDCAYVGVNALGNSSIALSVFNVARELDLGFLITCLRALAIVKCKVVQLTTANISCSFHFTICL